MKCKLILFSNTEPTMINTGTNTQSIEISHNSQETETKTNTETSSFITFPTSLNTETNQNIQSSSPSGDTMNTGTTHITTGTSSSIHSSEIATNFGTSLIKRGITHVTYKTISLIHSSDNSMNTVTKKSAY